MSLTLDLDQSLAKKLKTVASQNGTTSEAFAVEVLKDRLQPISQPAKRLSIAGLLERINAGISEEEWSRYARLTAKRRRENITTKELAELTTLSDRIEIMNARRVAFVAELARRRGTTLDEEIQKLGIGPRHV